MFETEFLDVRWELSLEPFSLLPQSQWKPCQGKGAYTCGQQGAVGMHTLYIALLSCKEGGKASRSEVQTLLQCEQCCREVMYVSERYGVC